MNSFVQLVTLIPVLWGWGCLADSNFAALPSSSIERLSLAKNLVFSAKLKSLRSKKQEENYKLVTPRTFGEASVLEILESKAQQFQYSLPDKPYRYLCLRYSKLLNNLYLFLNLSF